MILFDNIYIKKLEKNYTLFLIFFNTIFFNSTLIVRIKFSFVFEKLFNSNCNLMKT